VFKSGGGDASTNRGWSEMELYIIGEHIEDFQDGFITRRELLRRVTLITGSLAVTAAVLPALGCNVNSPPAAPAARASFVPSPTAIATTAATPFAIPPAARTTDGITVKADDQRISAGPVADLVGADGATLIAYRAAPKGTSLGGVLVVQENRGVTEHIKDVVRRTATAGFTAIAIDLLSREGGADKLGTDYPASLAKRSPDQILSDLRVGLAALGRTERDRLATVGFCFGGGVVWQLLNTGAPLRAAAPFYGPKPADIIGLAQTKAAVFAVYGEQDTRITDSRTEMETALKQSGSPYQVTVYPGANHAFHNDTSDRYAPDQAQKAWIGTIAWFTKYLAG